MITRVIKIDDSLRDAIVLRGSDFHLEARIPGQFKVATFLNTWHSLLSVGIGAMWRYDHCGRLVGLFGAMIGPDLCDGEVVAQEAFWYVERSSRGTIGGVKLYKEFMKWSIQIGAKRVIIAHLKNSMPEKLRKFYLAEGFQEVETHYLKQLP